LVKLAPIRVPLLWVPDHAAATVGVSASCQSDLVTVVDRWHTWVGEEQSTGQAVKCLISAENRFDARSVVAAEQIKLLRGELPGNS
jgi:NADPH-dependent ferric siderophore reductase